MASVGTVQCSTASSEGACVEYPDVGIYPPTTYQPLPYWKYLPIIFLFKSALSSRWRYDPFSLFGAFGGEEDSAARYHRIHASEQFEF